MTGIIYRIIALVLGIVFRRVFIVYMGQELSGLSGLYSNLIDFLNLALAGIGYSTLHKLYIYNAKECEEKKQELLFYTQRFYWIVTAVIFVLGMICTFFLDQLIYNNSYSIGFLRLVFLAQILSQCLPNLFYFMQLVLRSYEENYIINIVRCVCDILAYLFQIFFIVKYQNYYAYLVIVVLRFTAISFLLYLIGKKKHHIKIERRKFSLTRFPKVFGDLKDTVLLQISNFIYLSTDSIVLSKMLGLVAVNLYNNYLIIFNAVTTFFNEINGSIQSTLGNRLAKDASSENINRYLQSNFFYQHILVSFATISMCNLSNDFVRLWLGEEYVLSRVTVWLLCLNFFLYQLNEPIKNVLMVRGNFDLDKKITFTAAIINIVASVISVEFLGMNGVIIGTILSNIVSLVLRTIFYVKKIMEEYFASFLVSLCRYIALFAGEYLFTYFVCDFLSTGNKIIDFGIHLIVSVILPNVVNCIIFWNKDEMKKIRAKLKKSVN